MQRLTAGVVMLLCAVIAHGGLPDLQTPEVTTVVEPSGIALESLPPLAPAKPCRRLTVELRSGLTTDKGRYRVNLFTLGRDTCYAEVSGARSKSAVAIDEVVDRTTATLRLGVCGQGRDSVLATHDMWLDHKGLRTPHTLYVAADESGSVKACLANDLLTDTLRCQIAPGLLHPAVKISSVSPMTVLLASVKAWPPLPIPESLAGEIEDNGVEGVWQYIGRENNPDLGRTGGEYTLAVVPGESDGAYRVIYADGATICPDLWRPGMLKGLIHAGRYTSGMKVEWYDATGRIVPWEGRASVADGMLTLTWGDAETTMVFGRCTPERKQAVIDRLSGRSGGCSQSARPKD